MQLQRKHYKIFFTVFPLEYMPYVREIYEDGLKLHQLLSRRGAKFRKLIYADWYFIKLRLN